MPSTEDIIIGIMICAWCIEVYVNHRLESRLKRAEKARQNLRRVLGNVMITSGRHNGMAPMESELDEIEVE